jgi:hypothetical protein
MKVPKYEVADLLRAQLSQLPELCANTWQLRTLYALTKCRTAALGGHIDRCSDNDCGQLHISYNSCRNRHCPKCQGHRSQKWVAARVGELLDVPYYHLVFTLPSELNTLALHKPKLLYGLLFKTVWAVVRGFAANPKYLGAQTGMIAVLHTWGQNLSLHPHLHCIVPGGGIDKKGKWKPLPKKGKYLFPVSAMSKVFRAKFVAGLRKNTNEPPDFYQKLFKKDWVVYCKRPFKTPYHVISYLGRYTHKIAINNHRIVGINDQKVSFTAKNYRKGDQKQVLSLSQREFIRRFSQHILPKGFVRIRHYGFLSSTGKRLYLEKLKSQLGMPCNKNPLQINRHRLCPQCQKGKLTTVAVFDSRGPPKQWINRISIQKNIT